MTQDGTSKNRFLRNTEQQKHFKSQATKITVEDLDDSDAVEEVLIFITTDILSTFVFHPYFVDRHE